MVLRLHAHSRLADVVRASGMTVDELAAEIGSDKWAINDHLHLRRRMMPMTVARYCLALRCEPEDIIE